MPPIKFKQLEGAYLSVKTFFLPTVAKNYSDVFTTGKIENRPNFEILQNVYLKGLEYIELMETELNDNLQYSNSIKKGFLVTRLTEIRSTPLMRQYTREWWEAGLKSEPLNIDLSAIDIYFLQAEHLISQFREKIGFYLQHLAQSINIDEIVEASKKVSKNENLKSSKEKKSTLQGKLKTQFTLRQLIYLMQLLIEHKGVFPVSNLEIANFISRNFYNDKSEDFNVKKITNLFKDVKKLDASKVHSVLKPMTKSASEY